MKKERKSLVFSMFINLVVSMLKIIGGTFLKSYTLITSGYYTLCNFSEEFLATIGSLIGHKRANKKHPFGFGKTEYCAQILVGVLFILLAIYLFIKSLFLEYAQTEPTLAFVIISVTLMLFLNSNYLLQIGKDIHSQMLFASSHSSYFDALLTIASSLFILLSVWISFFDYLGVLFIIFFIFYRGLKIIADNIILINGQNDNSEKITNKIKSIVKKTKNVTFSSVSLINIKNYYCITVEIGVEDALTMGELIRLEYSLRKKIQTNIKNIKDIDFEILKK